MVIEIKVPETTPGSLIQTDVLAHKLLELLPHFIGFIVSFIVVSIFWHTHHRTFGYVTGYDGGLIWLNLFLLMMVSCLPFTTSLASNYGYLDLAYSIYSINLGLISLFTCFIWLRISNLKRK